MLRVGMRRHSDWFGAARFGERIDDDSCGGLTARRQATAARPAADRNDMIGACMDGVKRAEPWPSARRNFLGVRPPDGCPIGPGSRCGRTVDLPTCL